MIYLILVYSFINILIILFANLKSLKLIATKYINLGQSKWNKFINQRKY